MHEKERSSAKTAPPQQQRISGYFVLLILIGIALAATLNPVMIALGGLAIGACIWHYYRVRVFNRDRFPELYRQWETSYMCEQCGAIGLLGHSGSSLEPTEFKIIAGKKRRRTVGRMFS